jgi:hypothetical protein
MINSNYTTGNRTRDLPACSAVPQETAPPLAPHILLHVVKQRIVFYYAVPSALSTCSAAVRLFSYRRSLWPDLGTDDRSFTALI